MNSKHSNVNTRSPLKIQSLQAFKYFRSYSTEEREARSQRGNMSEKTEEVIATYLFKV